MSNTIGQQAPVMGAHRAADTQAPGQAGGLANAAQVDTDAAPRGGGKLKAMSDGIKSFFSSVGSGIASGARAAWDGIKSVGRGMGEALSSLMRNDLREIPSQATQEQIDALDTKFTEHVDELASNDHNPLGKFLRQNDDVSVGLKMLGGTPDQFTSVMGRNYSAVKDEMAEISARYPDQASSGSLLKWDATPQDYEMLFDATETVLRSAFDANGGELSLSNVLNDAYTGKLAELADQVIAKDGVAAEDKNEAIRILYNDISLRKAAAGGNLSTVNVDQEKGKVPMQAVSNILLAVANGNDAPKFFNQDVAPETVQRYADLLATGQEIIRDFNLSIGMPVAT